METSEVIEFLGNSADELLDTMWPVVGSVEWSSWSVDDQVAMRDALAFLVDTIGTIRSAFDEPIYRGREKGQFAHVDPIRVQVKRQGSDKSVPTTDDIRNKIRNKRS